MTGCSLQLTLTSTVQQALYVFDCTGESAAVVMDGTKPVGVVTRVALCGHIGRSPRPSDSGMYGLRGRRPRPHADEATTIGAFTRAAWRSLRRRRPLADETVRAGASHSSPKK